MIKGYLFINGVSEVGIDHQSKKYYINADLIHNDGYDYFMEISKEQLKDILIKKFNWVLKGWDKDLKLEYKKLLYEVEK